MILSQRGLRTLLSGLLITFTGAVACSSSTNGTGTTGTGSGSGSSGGAASCQVTNALTVEFSPMYSATDFDPSLEFQVPATVTGLNNANVTFFAQPDGIVSLTPTTASQQSENLGDVIITVTAANLAALGDGGVTITAEAFTDAGLTGLCGQSQLSITACSQDDYDAGSQRYHYGQIITDDAGCQAFQDLLSGQYSGAACINCHGATAALNFDNVLEISTVEHTPEQTGGFSDQDLTNIITLGQFPDAGDFTGLDSNGNESGLTYAEWQSFHKWTFDPGTTELQGIICYLRSLTPEPQTGAANFGRQGGGGGMGTGGGGGRGDGGFMPGDAGFRGGNCFGPGDGGMMFNPDGGF